MLPNMMLQHKNEKVDKNAVTDCTTSVAPEGTAVNHPGTNSMLHNMIMHNQSENGKKDAVPIIIITIISSRKEAATNCRLK
mmetsp:Transcript_2637/g.2889  ORF Transcript_2637/g.2889 Transcript_2637/m.2889 type:complete len:81 (-) Transcript_2637:168-410(-)